MKLLFPNHCAFCGKVTGEQSGICPDCSMKLPFIEGEICYLCGRKIKDCICKGRSHYYTACASALYYDKISKYGIFRIKDNRKFGSIHTLARLVSATIRDRFENVGFDYMTAVPMTAREIKKRGFNQSEILAKLIAQNTGIEFKAGILSKIYDTKPQKVLNSFERKGNISGVFHISSPYSVNDKSILLFDDIITTGSTIDECSKMLILYGAKEVYVCSLLLTASAKKKYKVKKIK